MVGLFENKVFSLYRSLNVVNQKKLHNNNLRQITKTTAETGGSKNRHHGQTDDFRFFPAFRKRTFELDVSGSNWLQTSN